LPNNTYDRYVTWAMEVPEGVAVPRLDRWTLPVVFPDPDGAFFPRDIVPMYAVLNTVDATVWNEADSQQIQVPAGHWLIFNYPATWSHVSDDYFTGFIQDTSGGTVYPPEAERPPLPVDPPPWVGDPNPPGADGDPDTPNALSPASTPEETE
jgi:hypothetical protein